MFFKRLPAAWALVLAMIVYSPAAIAGTYSGVYVGEFSDDSSSGGFAVLVNNSDVAVMIAYNFDIEDGFNKANIAIQADGSFAVSNVDGMGTSLSGTFVAGRRVSGTFVGRAGTGTFSGEAEPNTGSFAGSGGYYTGTARTNPLLCFGLSLSSTVHVIISAGGNAYFYSRDQDGSEDAGFTTIAANGNFQGTSVQGDLFSGRLAGTTITGSGTEYEEGESCSYTFSANRSQALPTEFGGADDGPHPAHDFDGDHRSDVLVRNTETGQWFMYPMDGRRVMGGANNGPVALTGALVWSLVAVADFDGDGNADVLVRHTGTGQWFMYPLNGRQVIRGANFGTVKLTGVLAWQPVGVADFNGDEMADVLVRHETTGRWFLYPLDGRQVMGGPDLGPVKLTSKLVWAPVAAADFTGDRKADMLVRNTSTGQWFMYQLDGRQVVAGPNNGSVALSGLLGWEAVGVADFNGDRRADVMLRDGTTGRWFLYPMDGRRVIMGADRGPAALTSSLEWGVAQVEDFNGDGTADVLVRNATTGQWFMYPMDGRSVVDGPDTGPVSLTGNTTWQAR